MRKKPAHMQVHWYVHTPLLNLQVITITYYMTKTYLGTGRDMKGLSETYVFTVW